jgi:hypothetical protein
VERLQLYELSTGNIGSTIRYEYLPRDVVPRPFTGPALFDPDVTPGAIPLDGNLLDAKETSHKPTRRTWTVSTGDDGTELGLPLYYWPGWRATVDGTPAQVWPAPDLGYLTLSVPAGEHVVEVWLGHTAVRLWAELVSLATVLGLAACGALAWRRAVRERGLPAIVSRLASSYRLMAIGYLLFAIGLILLIVFSPRAAAGATDLTMDFDRLPYLHHNPGGVTLGGWQLTGYTYSTDRLGPGDRLQVTLDVEAGREPANVTLRVISPAAVRRKEISAVATVSTVISSPTDCVSLELPIPLDAGPGMYLLQLEGETTSVYLRPIWVSVGKEMVRQPGEAIFADGTLHLHVVEAWQTSPHQLDIRLDWSAAQPIAANYKVSLRLADRAGNEWARLDTQPGYGFQPTSLWPPGYLIHNRYTFLLPEGTPPSDTYTLTTILYQAVSGESLGEHTVSITLDQATIHPGAPVLAYLGDAVALGRLDVPASARQGEMLNMTAYWLAAEQPTTDYIAEWQLATAEQTITATRALAPGSPPTTWPAGAWIAGRVTLNIPSTAPAGDYALSLTLRDPVTGNSLGSYTHPQQVHVEGQERVWELPAMQQEAGVRFGTAIELAGYDLLQERDTLRLTLYWQALAVPEGDYKFFVHVADPVTGRPATQIDAMPRESTYPTGMWVPGEVVSDELVISLHEVPPGQYALAVGWYDPDDANYPRLPATDASGNRLPDDRLVLPDQVVVP